MNRFRLVLIEILRRRQYYAIARKHYRKIAREKQAELEKDPRAKDPNFVVVQRLGEDSKPRFITKEAFPQMFEKALREMGWADDPPYKPPANDAERHQRLVEHANKQEQLLAEYVHTGRGGGRVMVPQEYYPSHPVARLKAKLYFRYPVTLYFLKPELPKGNAGPR